MAKPKKVPPTFIATGAENRCVVTVRMLAEEEEEGWMVEVEIQLQPDTVEGSVPDLWHIAWTHFAEVIRDNFWQYIDEHCPEPDAVREAVRNLKPPEELKDLLAEPGPPHVPSEQPCHFATGSKATPIDLVFPAGSFGRWTLSNPFL